MPISRKERERLTRESEVLSAAGRLFITKGFESTTMEEIAKASEFTKRTIYQYFLCKENLFFAVILSGVQKMFSHIEEEADVGKNGFEKLTGMRRALCRYIKEFPDMYRLMRYTEYIKTDPASLPKYQELAQYNNRLFTLFNQRVEEGIGDGSIRAELGTPLGIFALYFLTTGFLNRISEAGEAYIRIHHIDIDALTTLAFEMLDRLLGT